MTVVSPLNFFFDALNIDECLLVGDAELGNVDDCISRSSFTGNSFNKLGSLVIIYAWHSLQYYSMSRNFQCDLLEHKYC